LLVEEIRTLQTLPVTWSNRLGIPLTPISTGVWAAERPFVWNNIDVGGRSVICRMNDGSLLVHSPVNFTSELGSAIDKLGGSIGYIVSPNYEHLKYASQWNKAYPDAKMVACPGLPNKVTKYTNDINWDIELGHSIPTSLEDSIDTIYFDCESVLGNYIIIIIIITIIIIIIIIFNTLGQPFFNEVIFYHRKSKTCFMTDVYWNYPAGSIIIIIIIIITIIIININTNTIIIIITIINRRIAKLLW